jgi:RNA polymerase subunit RPABC4/transcription elongation factor Spt4
MQQEVSCPNCGARIPEGQEFCGACGTSFSKETPSSTATCPGCGAVINPEQRYCGVCGTQLIGEAAQPQAKPAEPAPAAVPQTKTVETEKATEEDKSTKVRPTPQQKTTVEGYGMLNFTTIVFRIVGWIILIGGCLVSIAIIVFAIIGGGFQTLIPGLDTLIGDTAIAVGIGGFIFSFVYGLAFIAFAELCRAVIRIVNQISNRK